MKVKVEVEVSKEAHELMVGLAAVVAAVKLSLADGFQPGSDLPAIVLSAVASLPVAIAGIEQLPAEVTTESPEFVKAVSVGVGEIVASLLKAPAVAA